MTATTTYYHWNRSQFEGEDGVAYMIQLFRTVSSAPLFFETEHTMKVGGVVIERDAGHPLAPVVASRMTLRWLDPFGISRAAAGYPYGEVLGVLWSDRNDDDLYETVEFAGYLVPGRFEDEPGNVLAPVTLGFNCGLGLLVNRPAVDPSAGGYDPADTASLSDRIVTATAPLSSANAFHTAGLVRATGIRPTGVMGEPSLSVLCRDAAFDPGDGSTPVDEAAMLRQVSGALGGRLFLNGPAATGGKPRWSLISRGVMADGSVTPFDTLDLGTAAQVPDSDASVKGVSRISDVPVFAVSAERQFREPLENMVINGSFEEAGATAVQAAYWDLTNAQRFDLTSYNPEANDKYHAVLFTTSDGVRASSSVGEQTGLVYIAASTGGQVSVSLPLRGGLDPIYNTEDGDWAISVGDYPIRVGRVEVVGDTLRGRDVRVNISPALQSTEYTDADAVTGTVIVPAGAVIVFPPSGGADEGTVTLREPLAVGDIALSGDLDRALSDGEVGTLYYFGPATGAYETIPAAYPDGDSEDRPVVFRVSATSCDGEPVEGYASVRVRGPVDDEATYDPEEDPPPLTSGSSVDDIVVGVLGRNGQAPGGTVTTVRVAGTAGAPDLTLPVVNERFRIGDGPRPDSPGALLDANGPTGPSGGNTWTVDHLAGTYDTLHDALAADALAQFGADETSLTPKVWRGRLLLRGGARLPLDVPLTLHHPNGSPEFPEWVSGEYWWDRVVWDVGAGTVDLEATELRLADVSGADHTYTLDT